MLQYKKIVYALSKIHLFDIPTQKPHNTLNSGCIKFEAWMSGVSTVAKGFEGTTPAVI